MSESFGLRIFLLGLSLTIGLWARVVLAKTNYELGGAFVCRGAAAKAISSAEIMDFFEAQQVRSKKIIRDNAKTVDAQLNEAIARLTKIDEKTGRGVLKAWQFLQAHQKPASSELSFNPPNTDVKKVNCPIEWLTKYDELSHQLIINQEVYDKLDSNTDRAGAYLHESIYRYLRAYQSEKNTHFSSELTSCLLQEDFENCLGLKKIPKFLPGQGWRKINDKAFEFYFHVVSQGRVEIYVTRLGSSKIGYEIFATAHFLGDQGKHNNQWLLLMDSDRLKITGLGSRLLLWSLDRDGNGDRAYAFLSDWYDFQGRNFHFDPFIGSFEYGHEYECNSNCWHNLFGL